MSFLINIDVQIKVPEERALWFHSQFLGPVLSDSENQHIYLSDPLCPSGGLSHQWLAQSEGAAL